MANTNKILGQSITPGNGMGAVLYTVPESTSAVTSGLFTVNTANAGCNYSIYAVPSIDSASVISTEAGWFQLGSDIDGEAVGDQSGYSVSLSSDGTRVAVGAPYNDGNGSSSGHVRVYQWNGTAWVQMGADIDGEAVLDNSGVSVSISPDGTRVAIGANSNDGNGANTGHVRVYQWNGSSWVQMGADINGEAANDYSGSSVSLSADGTRVAIGAPYNDGNGTDSGHVRVYNWNGSSWVQMGADINGEAGNDYSGYSVSLSSDGTRVAIGAPSNSGNGSGSGHVRIYQWNGTAWVQMGADIDGEAVLDSSGVSVSISPDGTRVAIGANSNDGNGSSSGHVRVYEWNGTAWVQMGADIDGEATNDYSGYSVSLSSDGTRVAVGAPYNDGNGTDSGHVRVYQWNGSSWVQLGVDIDGEADTNYSGYSVSLSADGTQAAIGAWANSGNGSSSGHVRVYERLEDEFFVDAKHALIKNRSILVGEHHEIQRGIMLNSGDAIWVEATDQIAVSLYGIEIS